MNKKIFIPVIIIILAVIAVYFAFIQRKPAEPVNAPAPTDFYKDSFVVGYEGDFQKISYSLSYPGNNFSISSMASRPSTVIIRNLKDDSISTIRFFYNGAAGFESATQIWNEQYKSLCPNCVKSSAAFHYQTKDYAVYEDNSDEWIIFSQIPGFVIADLKKPADNTVKILQSLSVSSESGAAQPELSTINVFFSNDRINPTTDCKSVVPVAKTILKTTRIASAAIETLLDGPSDQEKSEGYSSGIPSGSMLNSLSINNGVAYADFNSITESGGGSCSMAMRVSQIKQTLLQFPTIKSVVLSVNGQTEPIFQP